MYFVNYNNVYLYDDDDDDERTHTLISYENQCSFVQGKFIVVYEIQTNRRAIAVKGQYERHLMHKMIKYLPVPYSLSFCHTAK